MQPEYLPASPTLPLPSKGPRNVYGCLLVVLNPHFSALAREDGVELARVRCNSTEKSALILQNWSSRP